MFIIYLNLLLLLYQNLSVDADLFFGDPLGALSLVYKVVFNVKSPLDAS